ncbi:ATP-binding protein [Flavonifractor sp. An82]|uniref:ATP-binding protein n=1 Tax=Flavonifractor sp. An82 TaxID=1965660 RepID=UPI000B3736DD|nr:ATP-binding protein [Flavonifractor sp. An82]OUN22079.1 ATP-binding protein [Flavonifractor sp. An82]
MIEKRFPAALDQLESVQMFVLEQLKGHTYSERTRAQLDVAVEEIFVNIARYAYPPDQPGWALIRCRVEEEPPRIIVQFVDRGVPFDPLAKKDADITLSAEERQIGGLGILMVKRSMDQVEYTYEDGQNVLTLTKNI